MLRIRESCLLVCAFSAPWKRNSDTISAPPHSVEGEGRQYDYYAAGNSTLKTYVNDAGYVGWLGRSPSTNNNESWCHTHPTTGAAFRLSGVGSTTYPSMNKMIFENCDFNTRSIILRNVNPAKLIMQNIRSIGYTGRYLYNPTQQSGTAYIDGLVMDTANTGSDFLIDGMATVYVNSIGGAVLLHNYNSRVINTLVIS